MFIKELKLKNFRNYKDLTIDFDERVNLITGQNAQGKTNLIESLYISSIGRSFRTAHDSEMIRFGEEGAYIKVIAEKEYTDTKVEIFLKSDSRKAVKKDGNTVRKTADLLDNIIIVIFSPDDLRIVKDEPEKRRRFIDRELSQIKPAYFDSYMHYRRALMERNSYLKNDKIDRSMLDIWDDGLIRYGALLMSYRKEFVKELSEISGNIHKNITNGKESMSIRYDPDIDIAGDINTQQEFIERQLTASRENDIRRRTTTRGPHKDDISFITDNINVRNFGSQGQQRTSALSLKLAELEIIKKETGENAVLLLDDVMSELDEERREYLIRALSENQIFITTTDIDDSLMRAYPDAKIIRVEEGRIV
ncbi:MAG: DNA replication/repair protein RecF [Eubacterium sp.]|nr:DNA replication/repair protein RecF [Eubacterium sp.]